MTLAQRFARLSTTAKFLLILTAFLLPIGLALAWVGESGIRQADKELIGRREDRARTASAAIESLIARNALALRVAAAGALQARSANPCQTAAEALSTAPAISREFALRNVDGDLICTSDGFPPGNAAPLVAPGAITAWIDPNGNDIDIRVGVVGGTATASLSRDEIRSAALAASPAIRSLSLRDAHMSMSILDLPASEGSDRVFSDWPIGDGRLVARIAAHQLRTTVTDRLLLLLPLLMWIAAALITWLLVSRLLVRPLKRLQRSVIEYQPGQSPSELPRGLGPSREIQELRDAFARAMNRVDQSEREMSGALEGQRRLVREVHHRVKNNLQVVASLLSIHGRSAEAQEARAAYAGIGRRVSALSIVHRNHFAEMEENRGIALRPLVTELAAELRATAPETARTLSIDLEIDGVYTTQDVAVAVAFLITEMVEFAMLNAPAEQVEISLRRMSELTARLTLASPVLVPDQDEPSEKMQFERIIAGLAKQLRSPLERRLGRYSVDLPVFPPV